MREVTTRVYTFDELAPAAQERAIEATREMLARTWDGHDNEDISNVLTCTLAEKFGTPGWDTFGVADFPGIDGVRIDGWSLDERQALGVTGSLDRVNAPALPWVDSVDSVVLHSSRQDRITNIEVMAADPACTCPPSLDWSVHEDECPVVADSTVTDEQRNALEQAVRDALSAAWTAAEKEGDYKTGEEYAREVAADREFTEDGELYG